MNILTISNCPLIASQGSGYVITNFCQRLRDRGHHVDAFGPETYEPFPFLQGKAKSFRLTLGMLFIALTKLKAQHYDIVEFYGAQSWLSACVLKKMRHRCLIISHSNGLETQYAEALERYFGNVSPITGLPLKWYQKQPARISEKAFTAVDCLVTVSEHNAKYAQKNHYRPSANIVAIENALPDEFLNLSVSFDREPLIGYCGSWLANKGINTIVMDISRFLIELPRYSLRLIGVGDNFCKEEHFPVEICPRIQVVPFVQNKEALRQQYQDISILVMPSVYEGFGLVGAEGMACGCALVASKTGFAASLKHQQEALLIEEPRSPYLYGALQKLAGDDDLRRKIAWGGHQRVQSLCWSRAVDKLEQAYSQWLTEFDKAKFRRFGTPSAI